MTLRNKIGLFEFLQEFHFGSEGHSQLINDFPNTLINLMPCDIFVLKEGNWLSVDWQGLDVIITKYIFP